jgi:hypothetical protein
MPSPLAKLPIGSIKPRGWLRHMLELEAAGMVGHLSEISAWCRFESNAWSNPAGEGHSGWEELPYWLKGYGDLGYVLGDQQIIRETRRWVEAVLAGQAEDGWFGPRELRTSIDGKPDLWPDMVMLNVLQSYYEFSGDARVLPFMARYFRWELNCPEDQFLAGYWPRVRVGDNIESVYWLYNRTGEPWLLDVAKKLHAHSADWTGASLPDWHGVNIAQGFREPAGFYQQTGEARLLQAAEANYQTVTGLCGQVPGGLYGADENCRPGYADPRQGAETCAMVEFMHSAQMLTRISGEAVWADRCEDVAFNSFPAAWTPDLKALHYITSPNVVQLDRNNKSPGLQNRGTLLSYSPLEVYRCCQHNVAQGWPYYAEELWLATSDRGLCASLYAASEVTAKVGDGREVTLNEETDYPFSDTIRFTVATAAPVRFPLSLRIPRWCRGAEVVVNGQMKTVAAEPGSYIVIDRTWAQGDTLKLRLPMTVSVRKWEKNNNAVSVDRGPLTFALAVGEKWTRYGGTEQWPESEVFASSAWNYGLVLDEKDPANSIQWVQKEGAVAAQPFTPQSAPLVLRAPARRIANWQQDALGLVGVLQPSPIKSNEPLETVTLVPMGAARLRISAFPTISDRPDAREWIADMGIRPSASHVFDYDSAAAMCEPGEPVSSNDNRLARFTWWDHKGTAEWVQYDLPKMRRVWRVEVYWFDDRSTGGGCRAPQSWRLLYREGEQWKPVRTGAEFTTQIDRFNTVSFQPVTTNGLRIEAQLQPGFSAGIIRWRLPEADR